MNKKNFVALLSFGLELIPVILFFIGSIWNIFLATALLMIGSVLSVIIFYHLNNKFPKVTIGLAILALFFGALTLIFRQENIIKIKVTVLDIIISVIFFYAAYWKKNIMKPITPKFIKKPSYFVIINNSWGCFFLAMAILNEIVWRNVSTKVWVYFKVFGIPACVIIFALIQIIILLLYLRYKQVILEMQNR